MLYHLVPPDLTGDKLHPLNKLKTLYPELYERKTKKYQGREFLLSSKIARLNCLWNDVLHFTAVKPATAMRALRNTGFDPKEHEWFTVDPKQLESDKAIVYWRKHDTFSKTKAKEDFHIFDEKDLKTYAQLPEATFDYYCQSFKEEKRPLLFHRVAHILYQGSLELNNLKRIRV